MNDIHTRFHSPSNDGNNQDLHYKRHRAGSISGRLRAASDLEEIGMIDKYQKGLLKDKIIAGDPALQAALDKYDRGDITDLEAIIKSGGLTEDTVDLLDGLDLDFLNVGKGGAFQNFDDMDFPFDSMDDMGFRMRGMSEMGIPAESAGGVKEEGVKQEGMQFSHGKGPAVPDTQAINGDMTYNYEGNDPYRQQGPGADIFSYEALSVSPPQLNGSEFIFGGTNRQRGMSGLSDLEASLYRTRGLSNLSDFDPFPSGSGKQPPASNNTTAPPPHPQRPQGSHQIAQQRPTAPPVSNHNFTGGSSNNGPYMSNFLTPSNLIPGYAMPMGMAQGDKRLQSSLQPTTIYSAQKPRPESEKGYIGAYSPESRKERLEKFFEKRKKRVWTKKVKYDVRKNFADSRLRVKGRFVKKEDEELLRDLQNLE
mmetsp:Transcript_19281/g.27693  ORF Transcript_19281/g.27693 Transcript_19281/m.27693 type:complete len:422 (-) Transcript_19281:216-1481(-)|eukprot:CAMPEP_0185025994 /NCGR_PEP_ID=MMETSP1103-20130426/9505_1 /TAXON_ID=36769 /ORGANISM="Paraphysomonas bandaiensis, Strain Caron Lab Isolate" /LENGTH=421 /DNA_ID=CAMNT_0027559403 /DNA_START=53 /DNA_END=1318 /DNA_ORIENTATION=+